MSVKETLITLVLIGAAATAALDPSLRSATVGDEPPPLGSSSAPPEPIESSVYYAGCNDVRAAGKDPLYMGQPGYREGMDGDHDGIACEPPR